MDADGIRVVFRRTGNLIDFFDASDGRIKVGGIWPNLGGQLQTQSPETRWAGRSISTFAPDRQPEPWFHRSSDVGSEAAESRLSVGCVIVST
jgi:hypothetical protein